MCKSLDIISNASVFWEHHHLVIWPEIFWHGINTASHVHCTRGQNNTQEKVSNKLPGKNKILAVMILLQCYTKLKASYSNPRRSSCPMKWPEPMLLAKRDAPAYEKSNNSMYIWKLLYINQNPVHAPRCQEVTADTVPLRSPGCLQMLNIPTKHHKHRLYSPISQQKAQI